MDGLGPTRGTQCEGSLWLRGMSGKAISSMAFMESDLFVESRAEIFAMENIFEGTDGENSPCAEQESVGKDGDDFFDVMSDKDQGWGVVV